MKKLAEMFPTFRKFFQKKEVKAKTCDCEPCCSKWDKFTRDVTMFCVGVAGLMCLFVSCGVRIN